MYVIAVEEDGYMRDVTPRYAKQYSAKVAKAQSGGRSRREWWTQVVSTVTRPYRLVRNSDSLFYPSLMWFASPKHRDDVEDDELIVNQYTEGMPTTITGFKDHPLCASRLLLLVSSVSKFQIQLCAGAPLASRPGYLGRCARTWQVPRRAGLLSQPGSASQSCGELDAPRTRCSRRRATTQVRQAARGDT